MNPESLIKLLAWMALAYGVLVLAAWALQDRLLYLRHMPGRSLDATPAAIGLAYEDLRIETRDGIGLHAWLVPAKEARGTVVFFHGNAGNISHRLDSIRIFNSLGLSVLIPDYRGYGRSEGRPSEAGTQLDARATWRYLVEERGTPPGRIVLFGRSLGAAVAAELARGHTPAALILESPFTSVPDVAQRAYWFLPVRWLSRFEYATIDYVQEVSVPVLVMHSEDDEIIPFDHGRAVHEAARGPKTFLRLSGGHNTGFLLSEPVYRRGLRDFLDQALSAGPRDPSVTDRSADDR